MPFPEIISEITTTEANTIIAIFTVVLALTTIAYTTISVFMLNSLRKQLKQSRDAFLTDIVLKVMLPFWQGLKETMPRNATTGVTIEKGLQHGLYHSLMGIDEKLAKDLKESIETFTGKAAKEVRRRLKEKNEA